MYKRARLYKHKIFRNRTRRIIGNTLKVGELARTLRGGGGEGGTKKEKVKCEINFVLLMGDERIQI
jgi:hypothetical protein